ncbi:MAG: hypothetical protein GY854_21620 [Deltaproteobacteria bacterium]|nr:hypothetical protein [Deltaproteobacteria bacterium]
MKLLFTILLAILFIPSTTLSDPTNQDEKEPATAHQMENKWIVHADLVGFINPLGVAAFAGGLFRHPYDYSERFEMVWSHIQAGAYLGVNPAYAQLAAHMEWMPILPIQLHLEYDHFRYFANFGALLSFDSPDAHFGDEVQKERKGEEELGNAHRVLFRPILKAMVGPVVIRNVTDLAFYHFDGEGPYFFEWEYETLLEKNDMIVLNRTEVMLQAWSGGASAVFLIGPYYEITHAVLTEVQRQRVGGLFLWIPSDSLGALGQLRVFAQFGANMQDRNRKNEFYTLFGVGSDWTL